MSFNRPPNFPLRAGPISGGVLFIARCPNSNKLSKFGSCSRIFRISKVAIYFSAAFFNLFIRKGGKKYKVPTYISYVMILEKLDLEKHQISEKSRHQK